MVQGHGVAPGVELQVTLVGLRHGQARPWVGSGVHYSQETVLHLNFHVLELGKPVGAVCCGDTFWTGLSAIFCLNYIGHWCVMMSDYRRWLPLSGLGPGLHSYLRTRL